MLLDNFGEFFISLTFVNPLINPGSTEYMDYYLEDKNFMSFTKTVGGYAIGNVEDYAINTD